LKHIYRLVLNSKTYQLSSESSALNEKDLAHFSHYQAKRLTAEQILDALAQITEWPSRFRVFRRPNTAPDTSIPSDIKAAQIAEASESSLLAAMFGRPERATGLERERAADLGAFHVQFLVNSNEVEWSMGESPRIQRFFTAKKSDVEIVEEVFLAALSRLPKEAEKQKILAHFAQEKNNRNQAVNDLLWAVLNTNEFLLNH
jgi:DNA primase